MKILFLTIDKVKSSFHKNTFIYTIGLEFSKKWYIPLFTIVLGKKGGKDNVRKKQ